MLGSKEVKFGELVLEQAKSLSPAHRVAYLARVLWGSTYGWGDEIVGSTDCSGSLFWSLWLMGYKLRVTAQEFYDKYTLPLYREGEPGDLAFWWEDGKIKHVAIFTDNRIVLNASPPEMHDVPLDQEIAERSGRTPAQQYEGREIDWGKLDTHWKLGKLKAYGVNRELKGLFGAAGDGGKE